MMSSKWLRVVAILALALCPFSSVKGFAGDDNQAKLKGVIQQLPNTPGFIGDWMVSGRTIHVSSATHIEQEEGVVRVGAMVKVEGTQRTDGSIDAREIEVLEGAEAIEVEFTGVVQGLPSTPGFIGDWMVSGRIVHVSSTTKIVAEAGPVILSAMVVVNGTQRADGSIDGNHIVVLPNIVEFQGVIEDLPAATGFIGDWRIGGKTVHVSSLTRIEGTPVVGLKAEVHGSMRADGSIDASKIEILGAGQEEDQNVVFRGAVESLPSGGTLIGVWIVSGRIVHVTSDTRLQSNDGAFVMGATVKVKGTQMSDGSVLATRIQLKH
jgi:hypothetical protein